MRVIVTSFISILLLIIAIIVVVAIFAVGSCMFSSNESNVSNKPTVAVEQETTDNKEQTPEEKETAEERRAAEIERNRQNAEENKKKMEEQMKAAKVVSEKSKMDLLIPIAKEYKWTETDVRKAVQVIENCGISFDKLSNIKKDDTFVNSKVFSCDIKNTLYITPPLLCIMAQGNHINRIFVYLRSNINLNYFLDKRVKHKEPFDHSYSNEFTLYAKDGEQELSRNAFNEIIFDQNKVNKLNNQVEDYIKSKNGTSIDNSKLTVIVQLETNNYSNSIVIPTSEYMNSKIIWLGIIDYKVKSEVYGKDFDKYHAELLVDGDNVIEIANVETN